MDKFVDCFFLYIMYMSWNVNLTMTFVCSCIEFESSLAVAPMCLVEVDTDLITRVQGIILALIYIW